MKVIIRKSQSGVFEIVRNDETQATIFSHPDLLKCIAFAHGRGLDSNSVSFEVDMGNHTPVIYSANAPKPYKSWKLNTETQHWVPPVAMPNDGRNYEWNEKQLNWVVK